LRSWRRPITTSGAAATHFTIAPASEGLLEPPVLFATSSEQDEGGQHDRAAGREGPGARERRTLRREGDELHREQRGRDRRAEPNRENDPEQPCHRASTYSLDRGGSRASRSA
jgi:hypothetical protein